MESDVVASMFLPYVRPDARAEIGALDRQRLAQGLRNLVDRARLAWPGMDLSDAVFLPYVAERLPAGGELLGRVEQLALADLYLACACVRGDRAAIVILGQQLFGKVRAILASMRLPKAQRDDTEQALYVRLLVGPPGGTPQLASYSGRGPLQSWLCIVAVREGRLALRKVRRDPLLSEEALLDLVGADSGSELGCFKQAYRDHFRAAFRAAIQALSARERNVLRCHLAQDMTNAQIGAICGVHPGTVKRWMAEIREQLLDSTRAELQSRLGLSASQVDSMIRLIRSDFDVSIDLMPEDPALPVR